VRQENYHAAINELDLDKDMILEINEESPLFFGLKFENA
jgi:hypothetical protein